MPKQLHIPEFRIENTPRSSSWIILGPPGTGKSTFIENMVYYNKHKYPVGRVFVGAMDGYDHFKTIFPPLFVDNSYSEEAEKHYCDRQNLMILDNGKDAPDNGAINILDDVSEDEKIFKKPVIKALFKKGSRHWSNLILIGTQYSIDFPPAVRNCASFVAVFRNDNQLKKIYDNYAQAFGTYEEFCDIMKQVTGDHTCLIIDNLSQDKPPEERLFWYKTKLIKGGWKFGCKQYRDWADQRYDKNYVEDIYS